MAKRPVLYASVGSALFRYEVDVENAALTRREGIMLSDMVQYAWPHPSGRFLYVVWSNGGPGRRGHRHFAGAFAIDPATGALSPHGEPATLGARPLHVTLDAEARHLLVAYNDPSGLTVHEIEADGRVGSPVPEPPIDAGFTGHQVRVSPSGRTVVLVTRGDDAAGGRAENPGALKLFDYADGRLRARASVAPGGGYGFGPRHLDFHPTAPWMFVSIERQNQLQVFDFTRDVLAPEPICVRGALRDPGVARRRQLVGAIHVHPNGRFVYVSNRADAKEDFAGRKVFAGGENNIAVFSINDATCEPTLIQNADTEGCFPRTFSLDPSGRLLVAANQGPLDVRDGSGVRTIPASLAVFRVGADGKLELARKYEVDTAGGLQFWSGIVALPD